jgi:hypothetical protein
VIHRLAEERFKAKNKIRAEQTARLEPVHEALRAAATSSPHLADVRTALSAVTKHHPERPTLARPARIPIPKLPTVKLGSLLVVDLPSFQTLTG